MQTECPRDFYDTFEHSSRANREPTAAGDIFAYRVFREIAYHAAFRKQRVVVVASDKLIFHKRYLKLSKYYYILSLRFQQRFLGLKIIFDFCRRRMRGFFRVASRNALDGRKRIDGSGFDSVNGFEMIV